MKITSYNVIYYMNSEGITLRVLKATFLPSTKCILNIYVLKMNKGKKNPTVLCFLQSTMCSRRRLKPNKAFYSLWILYVDSAIKIYSLLPLSQIR